MEKVTGPDTIKRHHYIEECMKLTGSISWAEEVVKESLKLCQVLPLKHATKTQNTQVKHNLDMGNAFETKCAFLFQCFRKKTAKNLSKGALCYLAYIIPHTSDMKNYK